MELPGIHLLQAATMLAEVRNYSRAAKKLGIQQPTLTKRILELEHILGFQLFARTSQFVEPTEACRQFVEEARRCVFHAERALYVARAAENGASSTLHVGKSQYTDPYLVSVLISITLPLYPNLDVRVASLPMAELESEVLLGKLQLGLVIGATEIPTLTRLLLAEAPFYILCSENSDLAQEVKLNLCALRGRKWAMFDRSIQPVLYDRILRAAEEEGARPHSVRHVVTAEDAAQELYANGAEAAFLTKAGCWRVARNGLTMRPLCDARVSVQHYLIARSDCDSRLVSEFTRMLKRKLESPKVTQLGLPLHTRSSTLR